MFVYSDGFEIDGSDTTFNLVIPGREILAEVIEYYCSLPLWNKKEPVEFRRYKNSVDVYERNCRKQTINFGETDKITRFVKDPEWKGSASVQTRCLLPDMLNPSLKESIYKLSEGRPGNKGEFRKVKCPGSTLLENDLPLTVSLDFDRNIVTYPIDDKTIDGIVLNRDPLVKQISDAGYIQLYFHCGPSFIYEYAAFVMTSLAERFPSLGIYGGLDCAGGFMEGCTYSTSLYGYERFKIPLKSLEEDIKYLIDNKIIKLPSVTFDTYFNPKVENKTVCDITLINKTDGAENFALETDCDELYFMVDEIRKKKYRIDLKTYCTYVSFLIERGYPPENLVYTCAFHMLIPDRNDICHRPELLSMLEKNLGDFDEDIRDKSWSYQGFVTVSGEQDEYVIELRVDRRMGEYFDSVLNFL
ncbi:MAG: hypothetical protein ABRQ39_21515 [Candidatus Eremiobacterota bacterium]